MIDRKAELDQFKRINLCEYAASRDFVLDRRASSRHSVVMRHSRGDKLIVSRDASGVYFYFNAKGADSGTIIDLVAALDGSNLGEIRKTLRAYNGISFNIQTSPTPPIKVEPASHDAARVLKSWMAMEQVPHGHPYLAEHRGISTGTQSDPIFHDRIRMDSRQNAVFPHYGPGDTGLCGYEIKNGNASGTTFTGFSPGGVKALCCSRPRDTDREAVICETAIDMLSLAQLGGTEGRRFFSTAGQMSPMQADCLRSAVDRMPDGSRVVIATDNDDGGLSMATAIREALDGLTIPIINHHPPGSGEDWNDVLLQKSRNDFPEMRNT